MLRKRLVIIMTLVEGVLHRTKLFTPDYRYTTNFVDAWSIDEIVLLDIRAPESANHAAFSDVVQRLAQRCFVPLSVGGGVRKLDDVRRLLRLGADKVVVNTSAQDDPDFIQAFAKAYGSQCVVGSLDARRHDDGRYEVFVDRGRHPTGCTPAEWARRLESLGVGEILVTSIDRDGSLEGYDIGLCEAVVAAVGVPVLIAGGAGNWQHLVDGIREGGAEAACTANIYHFTETSIRSAKNFMRKAGIEVRL